MTILSQTLLVLIEAYRIVFPPFRLLFGVQGSCRFQPSCSEYAARAIRSFGAFEGSRLALKRLLRCHPFSRT